MRNIWKTPSLILGTTTKIGFLWTTSLLSNTTTLTASLAMATTDNVVARWTPNDPGQADLAKKLDVWPLDEHNAALLNEVHPLGYTSSTDTPHEEYDLIAIGSGAGGLVSSKQVRKSTEPIPWTMLTFHLNHSSHGAVVCSSRCQERLDFCASCWGRLLECWLRSVQSASARGESRCRSETSARIWHRPA